MKKPVVIFGTGDFALMMQRYFATDSDYEPVAFTVERQMRKAESFGGLPLVDFETVQEKFPVSTHSIFVAVGYKDMNALRARLLTAAKAKGYACASYISSRSSMLTELPLGEHCCILEDNTVQFGVKIGNDVILWSGNHVGHHAAIGDHCFVSSHVVIAGYTVIGESCFLGINATIRDHITLAPRTLVGAGATVLESTQEGAVIVPPKSIILSKKSHEIAL